MAERTLIIIKPDGLQRHLTGRIISRFEQKGFKLIAAKFLQVSEPMAAKLYGVHQGKPFFKGLAKYLASAPVLLTVWQAEGVVQMARKLIGATFAHDAQPGTIRGDLGCSRGYNLVHGSDSTESAKFEIALFFKDAELVDYEFSDQKWLYGRND